MPVLVAVASTMVCVVVGSCLVLGEPCDVCELVKLESLSEFKRSYC